LQTTTSSNILISFIKEIRKLLESFNNIVIAFQMTFDVKQTMRD